MVETKTIQDVLADRTTIDAALRKAARHAMKLYRMDGELVPIWEDDQVKWVRPEDIEAALDKAEAGR